jgi:hypothetical protein
MGTQQKKRSHRNRKPVWYLKPYSNFSYAALQTLLLHAKPGSEDEKLIQSELRRREKEPKQDPGQTMLFTGLEWARTKSPWYIPQLENVA